MMEDKIKSILAPSNIGCNFRGAVDFYSDLLFIPFVKTGDCYLVKYIVDENNETVETNDAYIYTGDEWVMVGSNIAEEEDEFEL